MKYNEGVLKSVNNSTGKDTPMLIEATETYPVIRSTTRKIAMQENVRKG